MPSFETEIKPLFREHDRESMQRSFDLWSHDDVSQHADAILARLRAGDMPCDGAWPQEQVDARGCAPFGFARETLATTTNQEVER
jgi:hypothetical protein